MIHLKKFEGNEKEKKLFESLEQEWIQEARFWSLDSICDSIRSGAILFYYECEKKLVGFTLLSASSPEAELLFIFVAKSMRKKGFSSILMNHLLMSASDLSIKKIFLEVRSSNMPAISLYRKMGFKDSGVRNKYYADGEDALLMELVL